MITILTPTYNRANTLPRLFDSLCKQTCFDFEWLIVDDGSTDNTSDIVDSFHSDFFDITYQFKKNGGKHTAMNYSHPFINGDLVAVVDSDDFLEQNAVETIQNDWKEYRDDKKIGILNYVKQTLDRKPICSTFIENYYVANDISFRVNRNIPGDRFEVIRTEAFLKYKMPEFENERFMGEGWLWKKISLEYDSVYINKALYNAEYLEGGLSKSGRLFRMKNPYGMMENCKGFMIPQVCYKVRLKETLLFGTYGFCADLSIIEIVKQSPYRFLQTIMVLPSFILFKYWSRVNGFKLKK